MAVEPECRRGKRALTTFKVVKRLGPCASLLEFKLGTGRTHQIRVHAKHIGHPLLADSVYGGDKVKAVPGLTPQWNEVLTHILSSVLTRQALHAQRLGFTHPVNQSSIDLSAELPDDMAEAVRLLEDKASTMPTIPDLDLLDPMVLEAVAADMPAAAARKTKKKTKKGGRRG
mmetsp:Transcript_25352/g.59810  ORF Transcript_25352/g.59810 Transcript_25352/m.59810 type:complete len:172 (+) Transcript_25352:760-1275(+)